MNSAERHDAQGFSGTILILLVFSCLIIISVLILVTKSNNNKAAAKSALDAQLTTFTAPDSCSQSWSRYNQGDGLDSVPTWEKNYTCSTNIKDMHEVLTSKLRSDAYKIQRDNFDNQKGVEEFSSDIVANNDKFLAIYHLENTQYTSNTAGTRVDFSLRKN
jgi:hypothetical protein